MHIEMTTRGTQTRLPDELESVSETDTDEECYLDDDPPQSRGEKVARFLERLKSRIVDPEWRGDALASVIWTAVLVIFVRHLLQKYSK